MSDDAPPIEADEGAPAWVMTFADLMSLLMCFFVLLLAFSEMDALKFKQIAGSMKVAFGVQREIKAKEIPKGTSIVAKEFSPGKPDPSAIAEVRQHTTAAVTAFRGDDEQQDDLTIVEVNLDPRLAETPEPEPSDHVGLPDMSWRLALDLGNSALQHSNPLPLMLQCATELQGLHDQHTSIYTVLAELYSNALEHGLLDLDSALKSGPGGFQKYYKLRKSRLETLTDGEISVRLDHHVDESGPALTVTVQHNGAGFEPETLVLVRIDANTGLCGRGIPMISQLCDSLTYSDGGRRAKAVISRRTKEG